MNRTSHRLLLALLLVAGLAACSDGDDDDDPMAPPPPPPPPPGDTTLRTATFRGAYGHFTQGSAAIVRSGEGAYRLDLGADFGTESAAQTEVKLCADRDCSAGQLDLGGLQSVEGAQSYALPDAAAGFSFVVIWCRPYAVPFGYGELV